MRRPKSSSRSAAKIAATLTGLGVFAALTLHANGAVQPPGRTLTADGQLALIGPPRELMAVLPPAPFKISDYIVAKNSSLPQALQKMGMLKAERQGVADSLKPFLNVANVAAGTQLKAYSQLASDSYPRRVDIVLTPLESLRCEQGKDGRWTTQKYEEPVERRVAAYAGVVTSSLWNSATAAGMDPQLVQKLTEIFAWQVDFHREVRRGDRWRLSVERFYSKGAPVRVGSILAAEYLNEGNLNGAVLAPDDHQYYTPEGGSLQRMFLRSPLRFAHITSGFSQHRFHPILKIARPHHGIDYGAPTGTPVMAVGAGDVTFAGTNGGSGKMIALRHGSIYATQYKHLSRFAAGIRAGARVKMGDVIGYVGQTGLATGPHLHFEFHVNGQYKDPQELRFPAADPVPAAQLASFKAAAAKALADLPPWSVAVLTDARSTKNSDETSRSD